MHVADRVEQARALRRRRATRATRTATAARATARRRRSRGRRPTTVRWSRSSVWTRRRSSPWRMSSANSSESGSGPRRSSGPSSPGASTHHAALRSWPYSRTSTAGAFGEAEPHHRALGRVSSWAAPRGRAARPARGGSGCDPTSPKSRIRYLPAGRPARPVAPTNDSGAGTTVFSAEKPERLDAFEHRAGERVVEPLGQRLHLRQLGHDERPTRARPRRRRRRRRAAAAACGAPRRDAPAGRGT